MTCAFAPAPPAPTGPLLAAALRGLAADTVQKRLRLAEALLRHPPAQSVAMMREVCILEGGTFNDPRLDGWGPHQAEITVLSCTGLGPRPEDAVADWIKAARRMAGVA